MNTKLLKSIMIAHGDTQAKLAHEMGVSLSRFNLKVNCKRGAEFTQSEILFIVLRYQLSAYETRNIFFD